MMVRQGKIEMELIESRGQMKPEYDFNRGKETDKGGLFIPFGIPRPHPGE